MVLIVTLHIQWFYFWHGRLIDWLVTSGKRSLSSQKCTFLCNLKQSPFPLIDTPDMCSVCNSIFSYIFMNIVVFFHVTLNIENVVKALTFHIGSCCSQGFLICIQLKKKWHSKKHNFKFLFKARAYFVRIDNHSK